MTDRRTVLARRAYRACRSMLARAPGPVLMLALVGCDADAPSGAREAQGRAGAPVADGEAARGTTEAADASVAADAPVAADPITVAAEAADATDAAEATETTDGDVRRLTFTGCDISKFAYMEDAAAAYRAATGVEIVVTGGGATRGIRATVGGRADLGGTCRHALGEAFPEDEAGAVLTHVAWDALVFFTHPSNPVDGLSTQQVKDMLLGRIVDWSEVGGRAGRIVPAFRRPTSEGALSGVAYMTQLLLFGGAEVPYSGEAVMLPSSGPVEEFVELTPDSFAVTGVSSARRRQVKILSLDGIEPSREHIASGRYPLFRPLYLVTEGEPQGERRAFLDWLTGPEGQAVISAAGTVNLAEGRALGPLFLHWPDNVRNR